MKPSQTSRERAQGSNAAETAAEWIIRRETGLSAEEEAEFQRWLASEPAHQRAFNELDATWTQLNEPRRNGRADAVANQVRASETRQRFRRRVMVGSAALAAAAAVLLAILPIDRPAPPLAPPAPSFAVRPNVQTLPDGSTVELNASAEFSVEYSDTTRRVRLHSGEALFQVMKDAGRPFVVIAETVEVQAVGTAFSVRHRSGEIDVLVTEGRVAVRRSQQNEIPAEPVYVDAGAIIRVGAATEATPTEVITTEQMADALAWRNRRVEFSSTPLVEAIALFNATAGTQLSLARPELGELRITGVFWTDDPEGFARLLGTSIGLKATPRGDRIVLDR
jgi:transmembrane sensor